MKDDRRILIFTGDGKGKTTAALGLALRAAGHGMKVLVVQFVKSDRDCGELKAVAGFDPICIEQYGRGFLPSDFRLAQLDQHRAGARQGMKRAAEAIASGQFQILILDEVCFAVSKGLVKEEEVIALLRTNPGPECIVMTGRGATEKLIAIADTVTIMHCEKHGMQMGLKAGRGVER